MILEVLHASNDSILSRAYRMGTNDFAISFHSVDVFFDMPSQCVLLADDPCAVFQVQSPIPKAEETLNIVAFHWNGLFLARWRWIFS